MNIDSIKNGIVIDHITAGKGMELYRLLKLDQLDCSVALIKNAVSQKMGKKDIIKIDTDFRVDMDILGYVCITAQKKIVLCILSLQRIWTSLMRVFKMDL